MEPLAKILYNVCSLSFQDQTLGFMETDEELKQLLKVTNDCHQGNLRGPEIPYSL